MFGISGIEYYPSIQCPGSPTGDYVSKLTTQTIAKKEMEFSSIIQYYIPLGSIHAEYVCSYNHGTLLYYKYGVPILTYISDLETSYKNKNITPQKIKVSTDLLDALIVLKDQIHNMNIKGFSHNAVGKKTIVYNESSKTAYLKHFDQSTYSISDDEECINFIIEDLSKLIQTIKSDFY